MGWLWLLLEFDGHTNHFDLHTSAFCDKVVLVLLQRTYLDVSAPGHFRWILDWTPLWHVKILYQDILGDSRFCIWLSLRCLEPWINHLYPVCWSTFWKSRLKWPYACKFNIMENNFFIVFIYHFTYILMPHNTYESNLLTFILFSGLKYCFILYNTLVLLCRCSLDTLYSKLGNGYVFLSHPLQDML